MMRERRSGHRSKIRVASCLAALALTLAACSETPTAESDPSADERFFWSLPAGFPTPVVSSDNPMSSAKVELGRRLFYDARLSRNGTTSCGTCHQQAKAFTDGRVVGIGSTGEHHPRNSMSTANAAYLAALTWANPTLRELESQANTPIFGEHPVELGFGGNETELLNRLKADAEYRTRFGVSFATDGDNAVSLLNMTRAIAAFERTMISGNSAFDRGTMSESAKRGEQLFRAPQLACAACHGGLMFAGSTSTPPPGAPPTEFFNNGLYNIGGTGAYPSDNQGIITVTGNPNDMGRFKAPTLRNIALTGPYMHDGSIATLDGVIDMYARGGMLTTTGPNTGDGRLSPLKNPRVNGFVLSTQQRADLLAFLEALTDSSFVTNAKLSNPWPKGSPANP